MVLLLMVWAAAAFAQTDEIQVYDAEIADPGVFNLMVHDNFTPDGPKTPRFPGGLVPNGALNGVPEWAYGVADWFEQGLYLPLYSLSSNDGPVLNGFKVRELFVVPHAAEQTFFYGINFEFSYNARHWDPNLYSSEIRPIIGWHLGKVRFYHQSRSLIIHGRDLRTSILRHRFASPTIFRKLGLWQLKSTPILA